MQIVIYSEQELVRISTRVYISTCAYTSKNRNHSVKEQDLPQVIKNGFYDVLQLRAKQSVTQTVLLGKHKLLTSTVGGKASPKA